ncbi:DUF1934 domain-containing protein [Alicyclobacillus herbarius]|uniref:DUF1934 domain-containing protein n=1 Tax=Alicyclobacillus herbarius TaxID=122960 RepID=UPI00040C133C|nr:DUF1934 domain-containing protein [Alicyclobacillus herbarius]
MWWYDEGTPERRVRIRWRRMEYAGEAAPSGTEGDSPAAKERAGPEAGAHTSADTSTPPKKSVAPEPEILEASIEDVRWRQKGGSHWFVYQEPDAGAAKAGETAQSALRLDRDGVTWMRRGAVTWTQRFLPGKTTYSELRVAGRSIPVAVKAESVDVRLKPEGGEVRVRCRIGLGAEADPDSANRVELVFAIEQAE